MSEIKSTIVMSEVVDNKDHKFGENAKYFPVYIEMPDGEVKAALLTLDQIEVGMERAAKNVENIDPEKQGGLFDWLFYFRL